MNARRFSCLFAVFLYLVSNYAYSLAQTQPSALRGLKNISVSVTFVVHPATKSMFENSGLRELTLKNVAEIKMRRAGIRLIESTQADSQLRITMRVSSDQNNTFYIFHLVVDLKEKAFLYRNPTKEIWGSTWGMMALEIATNEDVRRRSVQFIEDSVDDFINKYLAANSKK